MKKTLLTLSAIILSVSSYAEDLQCETSLDQLSSILNEGIQLAKQGSYEQLEQYTDQIDYTFSFRVKHLGKRYWPSDWVNEAEYNENNKAMFHLMKSDEYQHMSHRLLKPKANFISSVGEVCIIPMQSNDVFFGKKYFTEYDAIYVRSLENQQWRLFNYVSDEHAEDFKEFFPDFPKTVKLSAQIVNGKKYSDSVYEMLEDMYKGFGIDITPEVQREFSKQQQNIELRMKKNGFN